MPFYRVVFANNTIISCEEAKTMVQSSNNLTYHVDNGKLVYAYIKTDTILDAVVRANELIEEIKKGTR